MTTSRTGKTSIPSTFDIVETARLLEAASRDESLSTRLDTFSGVLLGRPYIENSLVGGPETPEVLTISLEAFDCVTYIEIVLALAFSRSASDVVTMIRRIRYEDGQINWRRRNHYMIDWARNNEMQGMIEDLTKGARTVEKTRSLSSIIGLPPRQAAIRCFPKKNLPQLAPTCETGDIILFASTRKWLDVFHVGMLIRHEDNLVMRHATRTTACVIEQSLEEFTRNNRMAGFMLLRPLQPEQAVSHTRQPELQEQVRL